MLFFLLLPFFIQMLVIGVDEFGFHIRRGLPKWERIGHPLDTLTVLCCFGFLLFVPYSPLHLKEYIAISIFSCLFVTKDEFVHKECCNAKEQWLHALLFLNHPIVLTMGALLWPLLHGVVLFSWMEPFLVHQQVLYFFILSQVAMTTLFLFYQIFYWNVYYAKRQKKHQ